jgi:hypothetical protein
VGDRGEGRRDVEEVQREEEMKGYMGDGWEMNGR